jgi:hypothetical protein
MTVDEYLTRLTSGPTRAAAELRPVAAVDMIAVELDLKRPLPTAYERFLTTIGCGRSAAGRWLHLDPTLSGNVLERRDRVRESLAPHRCSNRCRDPHCASDLYPIYESDDGTLYGFVRFGANREGGFQPTIYALKRGHLSLKEAAQDFDAFLDLVEEAAGPSESCEPKRCAPVASRHGDRRLPPARAAA